jgi:glutamate-1-semialdehyde 2,1-aminomutase
MNTFKEQYERASRVMPGGVNSSTRFSQVLGTPFFAAKGRGGRVWDIEGREYIDMCCAHGAGLLGHGHPVVDQALRQAMEIGYVNSLETEYHEELARMVCEAIPCADKVRFCSSGSEATLHLIRACRGFTGKKKIIRVEGHFHGYHELIYIGGHPPVEMFGDNRRHPFIESEGIPSEFADLIIPVPFNDSEALQEAVRKHGHETALLILEPVNFNCGAIKPQPGYLELARKLTSESGIVLFFDEIQSAFKKSPGGAQEYFGVVPDVCTIGKSLGGGFPLSAFCGRGEIMDVFKPVGNVQHSGTFNAHLVPVLVGLAFMKEIREPGFYAHLRNLEQRFHAKVDAVIEEKNLNCVVPRFGARFDIVLGTRNEPIKYEDTFCHDRSLMIAIVRDCLHNGVFFHDYGGAPVHHGYSVQHSVAEIDRAAEVLVSALTRVLGR